MLCRHSILMTAFEEMSTLSNISPNLFFLKNSVWGMKFDTSDFSYICIEIMRCFKAGMSALIFSALEQHLKCRPKLLSLGEAVTLGQGCHIRQGCVTAQLHRDSTEASCLPFCHPDIDDCAALHPCPSLFFWTSGRFILLTEISVWLWTSLSVLSYFNKKGKGNV